MNPAARRQFLINAGALLSVPLAVAAQQPSKMPRVGYLFSFTPAEGQQLWEACRLGLRELGYVEGRNIAIEARWTDGRYERLPELVAELVRLKVDVIVVAATPGSLAVKAATNTIPIVIVAVADPVRIGLVDSLARPGGSVTGLSLLTPELSGRRLQLLLNVARQARRVSVLMNPDNRGLDLNLQLARRSLRLVEKRLLAARPQSRRDRAGVPADFETGRARAHRDTVLWSHRRQVVALAARNKVPVIYPVGSMAAEGGLIAYGIDYPELLRRAGSYVDRILRGEKPGDLPVGQPNKFELIVNLRTATALGITVPQSVLVRANKVIE